MSENTMDPAVRNILDVGRRIMLMDPVADRLALLPMTEPTQRIKDVAIVIAEAAGRHDSIRELVASTRVMESLHQIARGRLSGDFEQLITLEKDLPHGPLEKPRVTH